MGYVHVAHDTSVDDDVMRADVAVYRALIADDEQRFIAGAARDIAGDLTVHAQAFAEFEIARDMHVMRDERRELGHLDAVGILLR